MSNYSYQAINDSGALVNGVIEAETAEMANNILLARGLIPSRVVAEKSAGRSAGAGSILDRFKTVAFQELILFTKQFRSMFMAGMPIMRLFQVLENQTENAKLRMVISSITQDIRRGSTLTEAMKRHPSVFSSLYCSMINAGEISGTLPETLERLIYIMEHEAKIKSDIKAALQYPIIVLVALGIAFFVLLTFVIPKFVGIFSKAGLDLPLPTKIAMLLYQILSGYWYIILGSTILGIVIVRTYLRTEQGKLAKDTLLLHLPLFGTLFQKAVMSRFASIFSILQSSGIHVMESLRILSGTIGNAAIAKEFENIRTKVQEGQGIAAPLRASKYFPPMVIDMVAIGEESGKIDEMLKAIAGHYDQEVEYSVKQLSDLIGPILVVGLAAVVGFFALSIFLPMWDLTKVVQK